MWHKIKAYYNNSDHIFSLQWNESRKNPEKAKVTHNMNQDAIFVILLRRIHCGGSIVRLEIGDIVVTIYSSYICTGVFTLKSLLDLGVWGSSVWAVYGADIGAKEAFNTSHWFCMWPGGSGRIARLRWKILRKRYILLSWSSLNRRLLFNLFFFAKLLLLKLVWIVWRTTIFVAIWQPETQHFPPIHWKLEWPNSFQMVHFTRPDQTHDQGSP